MPMSLERCPNADQNHEILVAISVGETEMFPAAQVDEIRRHAQSCPHCQSELAAYAQVASLLTPPPVPDELVQQMADSVRTRVLAKISVAGRRVRLSRLSLAAAALLVFAAGLSHWLSGTQPKQAAQDAQRATVGACGETVLPEPAAPSSLKDKVIAPPGQAGLKEPAAKAKQAPAVAKTPKELLKALHERFARAKGSRPPRDGDFDSIITEARSLATEFPASDEGTQALLLVSRCYTELADRQKAQGAFVTYAEVVGGRVKAEWLAQGSGEQEAQEKGEDSAAGVILVEAAGLSERSDHLMALGYCDWITMRYPKLERAWVAQSMVAECFERMRQPAQAVEVYQRVIRGAPPGSTAALAARCGLAGALHNAGRAEEAIQACFDWADHTPTESSKANAYYMAATFLAQRVRRYYGQAMTTYALAIEKYPRTQSAKVCRLALGRLQQQVEKDSLSP